MKKMSYNVRRGGRQKCSTFCLCVREIHVEAQWQKQF